VRFPSGAATLDESTRDRIAEPISISALQPQARQRSAGLQSLQCLIGRHVARCIAHRVEVAVRECDRDIAQRVWVVESEDVTFVLKRHLSELLGRLRRIGKNTFQPQGRQ